MVDAHGCALVMTEFAANYTDYRWAKWYNTGGILVNPCSLLPVTVFRWVENSTPRRGNDHLGGHEPNVT